VVGFFVTSEVFDSSAKETTNWPAPSQTTLNCCNAVLQASTGKKLACATYVELLVENLQD
jgi:hypothetical protein